MNTSLLTISSGLPLSSLDGSQAARPENLDRVCEGRALPPCPIIRPLLHFAVLLGEPATSPVAQAFPHTRPTRHLPPPSLLQCSGPGGFHRKGHQQRVARGHRLPCPVAYYSTPPSRTQNRKNSCNFCVQTSHICSVSLETD